MNFNILHKEVQDFINQNLKTDLNKLILKGSPFNHVSIQEIAEQIVSKSKCFVKLPTWNSTNNIYYPNKLNIEQTSSEITAKYKANLVSGKFLIDLTGGFGVDSYFFSKKIEKVLHSEINERLSKIVSHNIAALNATNIEIFCGNGIEYLVEDKNKYDWIYADPSRRNDSKGKVFLLKDCEPNIPKHLDLLFENSKNILLKLSPILDLTSAINELNFVKQIHIIAVKNEVKELLFLLEKNYTKTIEIKTININSNKNQCFDFIFHEDADETYSNPKKYLYEPNAAILKAGAFTQVSKQLKIKKLHKHSHLYTSNELIEFPGRKFEITNCSTYNKKELKKIILSKKANISIRNFPETVEQIRKKTGLKDGGDNYLFFTTDIENKHLVLICNKI